MFFSLFNCLHIKSNKIINNQNFNIKEVGFEEQKVRNNISKLDEKKNKNNNDKM